jgi:hypothetical protein
MLNRHVHRQHLHCWMEKIGQSFRRPAIVRPFTSPGAHPPLDAPGSAVTPVRPGRSTLRVSRGLAVLDRVDPGWWRPDILGEINLESLRMEDPAMCLLSQRYGLVAARIYSDPHHRRNEYRTGLRLLGVRPDQAMAHGFTGVDADLLTPEWRRVIAGRRARATAEPQGDRSSAAPIRHADRTSDVRLGDDWTRPARRLRH